MEHATPPRCDLDTIDVRELFRDHVFGCFIDDAHGIASIDEIGEDNIMCETDYPHSDSTWPDCIGVVQAPHRDLPEPVQYKILRGNAERLYRFTPADAAGAGECLTRHRVADRWSTARCAWAAACASCTRRARSRTTTRRRRS